MNPTVKNHKEKIIGYKAVKKDAKGYYTDGMGNVESLGDVQEDTEKCVTNKIRIIELDYEEEVNDKNNSGDGNSGNWNSGDGNSGNRNSGNRNSGDGNSGDWNSGNRNSGDGNSGNRNSGNWNSGNRNSGDGNSGNWNSGDGNSGNWNSGDFNGCNGYRNFFCTQTRYFLFDIECTEEEAMKARELDMSWFDLSNGYKDAWKKCPKEVLKKIKKLKNFNSDKFFEITGIK